MNCFLLVVCYVLNLVNVSISQQMSKAQYATYTKFLADQKRLWDDLFRDYDPTFSTIYTLHSSEWINQTITVHPPITEVKLTMTMLKLVDVVEVEEKVTFLFDYIAEWSDYRLKWNPLEYGGISHIYVPHSKVWLPEITIADAHEVKFFESDDAPRTAWVGQMSQMKNEFMFQINYNGTVGVYTSTVPSVICSLDVYKFPLDEHVCGVNVLFHTYFANEYQINSVMENFPKPLSQLGNGEWQVTWMGVTEENTTTQSFSQVQRFEAKFKRNPGFYVALVMVPAFFINFLSIIALFINMENVSEKITVGLTNIMAMTFILVILAADLPKTQKIPLLAIYVIVGLVIEMTSIAVVLILPRIRKYQRSKAVSDEKPPEPKYPWLAKILRIEFILMFIFQLANLVNFLVLFM